MGPFAPGHARASERCGCARLEPLSTSAKGSYGKSRRKPLKRKALTIRRQVAARVSLQPQTQPSGSFAPRVDWRPLTLLDGGPIKVGMPALAGRRRPGSGKLGCYDENPALQRRIGAAGPAWDQRPSGGGHALP